MYPSPEWCIEKAFSTVLVYKNYSLVLKTREEVTGAVAFQSTSYACIRRLNFPIRSKCPDKNKTSILQKTNSNVSIILNLVRIFMHQDKCIFPMINTL